MKTLILAALLLGGLASHAKSLEQQLKTPAMEQKLQMAAHAALVQHYTDTWDDQRVINYDLFSSGENLKFDNIRCLPTSENDAGVCLLTLGLDPWNGIEHAELSVTVSKNGDIRAVVLTQKDGPCYC